jgi:sulfite reductase (ferredoxin)
VSVTPESDVEIAKRSSNYLRGSLSSDLANGTPTISHEGELILKFHGIYAQDDRDVRKERAATKQPLAYSFMARVVIPGGQLTSSQWLALDDAASRWGNTSLRLTTRQAIQFHGIAKQDLRSLATDIYEHLLSSYGGCGDVVRNVVSCPEFSLPDATSPLAGFASRLAKSFRPASSAYVEIFVDDEHAASAEQPEHDFYGPTYLPRKFKIALAHPEHNCIDVYAQDIGLIPLADPEKGNGFNLIVGGGLGRSYANPNTYARLGEPFAFASEDEVEGLITAILETYRDLGGRTDRRRARLKYLIDDLGSDTFRKEVASRYQNEIHPPSPHHAYASEEDHLGWHETKSGRGYLGVRINAGRVRDSEELLLRSAIKEIATSFDPTFVVTAQQDLLISGISEEQVQAIEMILKDHKIRSSSELGPIERSALACPALPTCPQALAEAERVLPDVVNALEGALAESGMGRRPLQLRMTGCPNGCARPAVAELGVVGRTKSTYDIFLGGGPHGDRLAKPFAEKVSLPQLPEILTPLFLRWKEEGQADERFGDFITRVQL